MSKVHGRCCGKAENGPGGVRFVLSDETIDRDGETIQYTAWGDVTGKSVPFLYGHDPSSMANVIGRLHLSVDHGRKALVARPVFSQTAPGQMARQFVEEGTIDTVSVGFNPLEWTEPDGKTYATELGDWPPPPAKGRAYTKADVLEGSLVPIPSNPNARQILDADARMRKAFESATEQPIEIISTGDEPPLSADEIKALRSIINAKHGERVARTVTIDNENWFEDGAIDATSADWFETEDETIG